MSGVRTGLRKAFHAIIRVSHPILSDIMCFTSGGEGDDKGDDKPVQIGIDREGGLHLFNKSSNRIRVYEEYPDAEPAYEYDLNAVDKSITAWIAYVEQKRGWKQRSFITAQDLYEGMKLRQQNRD